MRRVPIQNPLVGISDPAAASPPHRRNCVQRFHESFRGDPLRAATSRQEFAKIFTVRRFGIEWSPIARAGEKPKFAEAAICKDGPNLCKTVEVRIFGSCSR